MRDHADVIVVGSGPGGATVARRLALAGHRVIVVEAGPVARARDFRREAGHTMARLFWDGGMRTTSGNAFMPTLHGRVLGGGSVVNSAICLRAMPFALRRWEREHGLTGFGDGALDRHFDAVEALYGVRPTAPAVMGPRNELFLAACEALGWKGEPIARNETGCNGLGECMTGCRVRAKNSTDIAAIPDVLAHGGRVYTSVVAERLVVRHGRVRGIEGHVVDPITFRRGPPVRITARVTVLSAGPMANPALALRSGLRHPRIGKNLLFHPGTSLSGVFPEDVFPWAGASQGAHCTQFIEPDGIKLESLWAPAALLAFRFPGMGDEFKALLKDYRRMAVWDCWVSGDDSEGEVRPWPVGGRATYSYNIGAGDVARMKEGMARIVEMFFAAGAESVVAGIHGLPAVSDDPGLADAIRRLDMRPSDLVVASNHAFGTMAMGADPGRHPVDPTGAVRGVEGLYVADTSLFPESAGANPMLTAMALADRVADFVALDA